MSNHKKILETVNDGCCWVDCSCGWSGGAHRTRKIASEAHSAHVNGDERVAPIQTEFYFYLPPRSDCD